MKYEQNNCNQFSFKLCIKASIICIVLLMALQTYAEEKATDSNLAAASEAAVSAASEVASTTATDAKAAMAAVKSLLSNESNKPEVIVEEIPEDIKLAIKKELVSKIEIIKTKTNESSSLVFRAPIYKVKPLLGYIAVVDGEILNLDSLRTNTLLSDYLKLIRDDFRLDSEANAELLEKAIQVVFPYKLKNKIIKPVKVNHGWIIVRDDFFKNYSGLVFTTDDKGKITVVEYIMKINPKDFSYKKQEY